MQKILDVVKLDLVSNHTMLKPIYNSGDAIKTADRSNYV